MDLTPNVSRVDAGIRYALAVGLLGVSTVSVFRIVPPWLGIGAFVLASALVLTASAHYCPLYALVRRLSRMRTARAARMH